MINGPFMRKAKCMTRLPQTTLGSEALLRHSADGFSKTVKLSFKRSQFQKATNWNLF